MRTRAHTNRVIAYQLQAITGSENGFFGAQTLIETYPGKQLIE